MPIEARYPGVCSKCDEKIEVGQLIWSRPKSNNTDALEWEHHECPETVAPKPTRFQGTTLEDMGL
jgi:hypothetical protein